MTLVDGPLELLPFEEASAQVIGFLKQTLPMALWSVTRVADGRQTYLAISDDAYGKVAGDSVAWSDSLCQHMVAGTAPAMAPDAMAVPEYAQAPAAQTLPVGAYVGAPIRAGDGTLFGTICGIDPERRSDEILVRAPGLRLLADLLGRVLEASTLRAQAERRTRQVQEAQAAVARSEAMYRLLVGASRDVISRHTPSGEVTFASPAVGVVLGWCPDGLVGRGLEELVHPDDLADVRGHLDTEQAGGECTFRVRHRDGRWVWVESTATVLRDDRGRVSEVLVCSRDITARRARETASQRESLERLSAGLAHGINTPMQYVGDNARFLAEAFDDLMGLVGLYRGTLQEDATASGAGRLPAVQAAEQEIGIGFLQTEVPSAVEQTLAGIDRVAAIVRSMRTFTHPGHGEQVPVDLVEALSATATVVRHQVAQVVDLELALTELPPVRCDLAELNQVFSNLIVYAADAVREAGGRGTVLVGAAVDGADVVVTVRGTGPRVPPQDGPGVPGPSSSAEELGREAGRGLRLARSVVHDGHGGTLSVSTEVGVGTTLTVRLPVAGRTPVVRPVVEAEVG